MSKNMNSKYFEIYIRLCSYKMFKNYHNEQNLEIHLKVLSFVKYLFGQIFSVFVLVILNQNLGFMKMVP